jgi:hypothetical protein
MSDELGGRGVEWSCIILFISADDQFLGFAAMASCLGRRATVLSIVLEVERFREALCKWRRPRWQRLRAVAARSREGYPRLEAAS